ncbi:MAG TPA: beta-ketoacyl-[acyl-carrier-protein] synthase family protein [Planctomycetaceae bacterium]|nr:beta-ketoacyl-[acyl-carrier-protein] synthase family protein [Planctomycetaceae bacterium]
MRASDIVITGAGAASPIGLGYKAICQAFREGRCGIARISAFDASALPVQVAGEVVGFDPKPYVRPRKALKLMGRESQLGVAATAMAVEHAGVTRDAVDPERMGIVLGADRISGEVWESEPAYRKCIVDGQFDFSRWYSEGMAVTFPLAFLKVLPNMIASHVSIAQDARGPNNTIHQGEASSLLAIAEACRIIQRGAADVMIAGGASATVKPFDWTIHCVSGWLARGHHDPATVLRPFDLERTGQVYGEGAAVVVLERREHAEARGAKILAQVLGWASAWGPLNGRPGSASCLQHAIRGALDQARLAPSQIGHVNAHGAGGVEEDVIEAQAISRQLPDVPVTAPKSYFGNLLAASGAMEMLATLMAFEEGILPPTLNYQRPDPRCPIPVVAGHPARNLRPTALLINWTAAGQATTLVVGGAS